MPVVVEKRVKARARQKQVAEEYRAWLKRHPKASRERRIKALDAISDSAFLSEMMNKNG
jgi:hypothetical protein